MITANRPAPIKTINKELKGYRLSDTGDFTLFYEDGSWVRFTPSEWKYIKEAIGDDKDYDHKIEVDKLTATIKDMENNFNGMKKKYDSCLETKVRLDSELTELKKKYDGCPCYAMQEAEFDADFYRKQAELFHTMLTGNADIPKLEKSGMKPPKYETPTMQETTEQHKDTTPDEMMEVFTGIFNVWEENPEYTFSELIYKAFKGKHMERNNEKFVKALKESFNYNGNEK